MSPNECAARQYSDAMVCMKCGLGWGMNDPYPPICRDRAEQLERRAETVQERIMATIMLAILVLLILLVALVPPRAFADAEERDRPLPQGNIVLVVARHDVVRDRWHFTHSTHADWPVCFHWALVYVLKSTLKAQYYTDCAEERNAKT